MAAKAGIAATIETVATSGTDAAAAERVKLAACTKQREALKGQSKRLALFV